MIAERHLTKMKSLSTDGKSRTHTEWALHMRKCANASARIVGRKILKKWGDALKIPKQPCRKDCPDRTPICHAECEKYEQFRIAQEIYRKAVNEAKEKERAKRPSYRKSLDNRRY